MTKSEADPQHRVRVRSWALAIVSIVLWVLAAANSAEAQVPSFVLAQVLGPEAAESVTPPQASVDPVKLVAGRMAADFQDQLVAGVNRPAVELEVHFDFDSDVIHDESDAQIEAAALILKDHFPDHRFRVAGYTDAVGSADYNQQLSERRAGAVWQVLVEEHGVSADRLERVGYGEEDPMEEATDAQRRRVELQIVHAAGAPF